MTHICVSKLTIIGSDNGLPPDRRQAITWTNVGILLIQTLGTNFSEILGEIHSFSFKKVPLKLSAKWRPFCFGLNALTLKHPSKTTALTQFPEISLVHFFYLLHVSTSINYCGRKWSGLGHKGTFLPQEGGEFLPFMSHRLLHNPSLVAVGLSVRNYNIMKHGL